MDAIAWMTAMMTEPEAILSTIPPAKEPAWVLNTRRRRAPQALRDAAVAAETGRDPQP